MHVVFLYVNHRRGQTLFSPTRCALSSRGGESLECWSEGNPLMDFSLEHFFSVKWALGGGEKSCGNRKNRMTGKEPQETRQTHKTPRRRGCTLEGWARGSLIKESARVKCKCIENLVTHLIYDYRLFAATNAGSGSVPSSAKKEEGRIVMRIKTFVTCSRLARVHKRFFVSSFNLDGKST